jgi:2-polyprenyl-3-methyl-5-hydroxy-6-metoxy-1,4-benzoquinol methylase
MTLQNLRREGFNVVGYEPHQSTTKAREGTITSRDVLVSQRFDGIFSNNVLEHLQYPIDELQFMASLLTAGGRMAHATPCYEYRYEYTRFHLFFYLGRSRKVLADKAGLDLQEFIVDGDFMCGIFAPRHYAQ